MTNVTISRLTALAFVCSFAPLARAGEPIPIDTATFGNLRARAIGPATMSGRIAALDAVEGDRLTIYVGAASGGVWKSTDGGTAFKPVFDEHTQSIGAVAIDPQNTETVWVGTGETWTRNSVSVGDGVYKTTDGGETWKLMGLPDSEHIARIRIDPGDSDRVFVCATGHLWDDHPERGIYRTTDGGETWEAVLQIAEDTGCADLVMDPSNPDVLYAGMWQFRRRPDFFTSGGPHSGLYKTTDGGDSWKEIRSGLPSGDLGRIGLDVAPSNPKVVYAVVEAEKTALYRSDDAGETWVEKNSSMLIQMRPFYFATVKVDPTDEDVVYKPSFSLAISEDGGTSFTAMFSGSFGFGAVHPDMHALWINPKDRDQMLLGTDGGVYFSEDQGNRWRHARNLPVSQFYQIGHDMDVPYNVYGGLQDNGSWFGPSRAPGGVQNKHWTLLSFGDGFWSLVDPEDPDIVYTEMQGGGMFRVRRSTGEIKEIKPLEGADDPDYRFNWNAPMHIGRSGALYYGGQFVFRSTDKGDSWQTISPDLTTDDEERQGQRHSGGLSIDNSTAENNTTIYSISESPMDAEVVWAGSDDGNVQVTRDGGETWTNVVGNVPGLPAGLWVSEVQASRHDAGTAYLTVDGHRSGDMRPYVYKTTDFGATWTSLATDDVRGFAHVIRDDLVNPDLLFLGTEFGLFLSLDGGQNWAQFGGTLPNVAVHDVRVHPREHDLIIGTHGRGIYIVDDITPIRTLTAEAMKAKVAMLGARPAIQTILASTPRMDGDANFIGEVPQEAAFINYHLPKRHIFGDLKIEIYDAEGELISTVAGGKRRGINRVAWPMCKRGPKVPPASSMVFSPGGFLGPRSPEGEYTVKLIKGKDTYSSTVTLAPDPRSTHTREDRQVQQQTAVRLYDMVEDLAFLADSIVAVRDGARARAEKVGAKDRVAKDLGGFADTLDGMHKNLVAMGEGGWLSGEEQLREKVTTLYGAVNGYEGRPSQSQLDRADVLADELGQRQVRFEGLMREQRAALNRKLASKKLDPIEPPTREEWEAPQR